MIGWLDRRLTKRIVESLAQRNGLPKVSTFRRNSLTKRINTLVSRSANREGTRLSDLWVIAQCELCCSEYYEYFPSLHSRTASGLAQWCVACQSSWQNRCRREHLARFPNNDMGLRCDCNSNRGTWRSREAGTSRFSACQTTSLRERVLGRLRY